MRIFKYFFLLLICFSGVVFASEKDSSPRFVLFSPPKCGTHLGAKVLAEISKKKAVDQLADFPSSNEGVEFVLNAHEQNGFVVAHNFTPKMLHKLTKKGYKIIFLLRDPRDQLISMMNWMREGQWNWLPVAHISDRNEQIDELITGSRYGWRCYEHCILNYELRLMNVSSKYVYFAYYENLVGPNGGGSLELQQTEILNIAAFLNIDLSLDEATGIANNAYGNTNTFRTGKIGNWKNYFTKEHKDLFKSLYRKHLKRYGYEANDQW